MSRSSSSSSGAASDSHFVEGKKLSRSRSISSRSRSRSTSSRSRSRSPVSRSRSRTPISSRSSSPLSSRSPSPEVKAKLKVKIKNRQASKALKDGMRQSEEDEASEAEEEEEEELPARRGRKAKSAAAKSPAKAKKKSAKAASEEGELSSDGSAKEFDDGLDEDLIGDDEDRANLEKMTEREREQELFNRATKREELKKRFDITRKLKHQQRLKGESAVVKESKSSDDEDDLEFSNQMLDAKERSQDRRKNLDAQKFDKKSSALSELKARKAERERKEQEKKERREKESKDSSGSDDDRKTSKDSRRKKRRDSSSSSSEGSARRRSSSSSSSSPSSSEAGSDTERFKKTTKVQKYVETQEDLEPIRLSRFKMERFVHLPFFKRLVTGCFVRIGIGQHEGKSVYRCTEVVEVCDTAKVYQVGKARTNVGLKLRFGKQERVFRLEFISNSVLSPTEFEKWKATSHDHGIPLPTRDFVQSKAEEIRKALNYEYSSADVDAIVERKEKFSRFPVNYAMTKARLMKEKEIATADHDVEKAAELEQKLQDLEHRAEELDKKRTENTRISSISLINNRNRKNNVLKAEQAIHEEIKRKEIEGVEMNPFTRRRCTPRMVTKNSKPEVSSEVLKQLANQMKENRKDAVDGGKRKNGEDAGAEANGDVKGSKKPKVAAGDGSSAAKEASAKEDLFDAHDFDIDIDMEQSNGPSNAAPVGVSLVRPASMAPRDNGPAKRSLNLSDYKKKRGLI